MRSFMIADSDVADLLIAQFNDAWIASTKLIEGGILEHANIENLNAMFLAKASGANGRIPRAPEAEPKP